MRLIVSRALLSLMCTLMSSIFDTLQTISIFNLFCFVFLCLGKIWLKVFFLICYSQCRRKFLSPLIRRSFSSYLQFKELTYGLQKTNASTLLRSCLEYVMNHYNHFLPGEGGYLLDLLQDVSFYCYGFYDFYMRNFLFLPLTVDFNTILSLKTHENQLVLVFITKFKYFCC